MGAIYMNTTVEKQELDIDIQQVKRDFQKWRWRQAIWILMTDVVGVDLIDRLDRDYGVTGWNALRILLTTWEGWTMFVLFGVACFIFIRLMDNKYHFQCPHPKCNMAIDLNDPWVCPYCPNNNVSYPEYLQRRFLQYFSFRCTIFDKCAVRKHVPQSYKCMSPRHKDGFVFELIPGGNTELCAYKYEPSHPVQALQSPPAQPKQEEVKTGELITKNEYQPRDFFH